MPLTTDIAGASGSAQASLMPCTALVSCCTCATRHTSVCQWSRWSDARTHGSPASDLAQQAKKWLWARQLVQNRPLPLPRVDAVPIALPHSGIEHHSLFKCACKSVLLALCTATPRWP